MKVLTPKEQIEKLIEAEDVLSRSLAEFAEEEQTRLLSIEALKQDLRRELRSVDAELSPKQVVENSRELQQKYRGLADDLRVAGEALAGSSRWARVRCVAHPARRQPAGPCVLRLPRRVAESPGAAVGESTARRGSRASPAARRLRGDLRDLRDLLPPAPVRSAHDRRLDGRVRRRRHL